MPGTGSAWINENNPRALKEFGLAGTQMWINNYLKAKY